MPPKSIHIRNILLIRTGSLHNAGLFALSTVLSPLFTARVISRRLWQSGSSSILARMLPSASKLLIPHFELF